MPSESLTVAVTSGFGIGIIAGIVSGVCYILVHRVSVNRPRKNNQWHCITCGERFRSIGGVLDLDKVVTCTKCYGKICRKCANQDQENWICQSCLHPDSWFKGMMGALYPSSIINKSLAKMDPNRIDEEDEDLELVKKKEKEKVREFMERLVESMLGGNIDGASIGRLYGDNHYDILLSRYHSDLTSSLTHLGSALHMSIANLPVLGESPCSAHAGLKLLIQKVIQDAISLPALKKVEEHPGAPVEEINRSYEDLLATAIINKVIENYQDELPTSSANSVSSRRSNFSVGNNREYFFGEETLDTKWRNCNSAAGDVDTTSVSSVEEWIQSGSSSSSTKYVDHKSLTIQQHRIQEVSSSDEEDRPKEWKENWKLQRRQFAGSASPVPVPMLVPNPTVVAKVLIGDREADDTTDLSDAGSECDETERLKPPKLELEDEVLSDGTTDDLDIEGEKDRILEQFSSYQPDSLDENIWQFINTNVNYSGNFDDTSLDSHIEQDSEYTEKYATLPKTILKCSTPVNSVNDTNNLEIISNGDIHNESTVRIDERELLEDNEELRKKFEGSYSEREKQKWNHAVEMKNNPYTEENINRRLKTSSVTTSLFGRDYYIKEAAKAAGARNAKDVNRDDVVLEEQEKASNETAFIFKAVPAIIEADSSYNTDSESLIEIGSSAAPSSLLEISSDSDLSIERTYNLTSGKVYEKVGNLHKEIVKRTSSPEGLKFMSTTSEIVDENHNSMTSRKLTFLRSLTQESEDVDNISIPTSPICEEVFYQNIPNVPLNDETFEINSDNNSRSFSVQEISIDFSTEGEIKTSTESSLNSTHDSEIGDLKQQHLVKDRLGEFSRSYPNLASKRAFGKFHEGIEEVKKCVTQETLENGFEDDDKCVSPVEFSTPVNEPSVNDLRKKFATIDTNESLLQKQVHSLTARSIPQLIRKELQEDGEQQESHNHGSNVSKEEVALQAAQLEEATVITEQSVLSTFPNAKSRIKFFENLNR